MAKGREEKRLMVVCVYRGRVKLANDVTYKRYVYCWEMRTEVADVGCAG